eukprot:5872947-Pleurochrysis_carterae.AAC.1
MPPEAPAMQMLAEARSSSGSQEQMHVTCQTGTCRHFRSYFQTVEADGLVSRMPYRRTAMLLDSRYASCVVHAADIAGSMGYTWFVAAGVTFLVSLMLFLVALWCCVEFKASFPSLIPLDCGASTRACSSRGSVPSLRKVCRHTMHA